jgi:hypothetical protein
VYCATLSSSAAKKRTCADVRSRPKGGAGCIVQEEFQSPRSRHSGKGRRNSVEARNELAISRTGRPFWAKAIRDRRMQ